MKKNVMRKRLLPSLMLLMLSVFSVFNVNAAARTGIPLKIVVNSNIAGAQDIWILMPNTAAAIANGAGNTVLFVYKRNGFVDPDEADTQMELIIAAYANKFPVTLAGDNVGGAFALTRTSTGTDFTFVPN